MNTMQGLPIYEAYEKLQHEPSRKNAIAICKLFTDTFGKLYPKEMLWFMIVQLMKAEDEELTGKERDSIINFYEHLLLLFGAVGEL